MLYMYRIYRNAPDHPITESSTLSISQLPFERKGFPPVKMCLAWLTGTQDMPLGLCNTAKKCMALGAKVL